MQTVSIGPECLTVCVVAFHSSIALLPASEKKTLPAPSTATPPGYSSPEETRVTGLAAT